MELCQICGKKNAEIQIENFIEGKEIECYICKNCAKKLNSENGDDLDSINNIIKFLINNLMDENENKLFVENYDRKCKVCGMTFSEFQKIGILGCDNCYKSFEKDLSKIISKINRSSMHIGKTPRSIKKEKKVEEFTLKEVIQTKKFELDKCVKEENYEKAAILRDEINELKNCERKSKFE